MCRDVQPADTVTEGLSIGCPIGGTRAVRGYMRVVQPVGSQEGDSVSHGSEKGTAAGAVGTALAVLFSTGMACGVSPPGGTFTDDDGHIS